MQDTMRLLGVLQYSVSTLNPVPHRQSKREDLLLGEHNVASLGRALQCPTGLRSTGLLFHQQSEPKGRKFPPMLGSYFPFVRFPLSLTIWSPQAITLHSVWSIFKFKPPKTFSVSLDYSWIGLYIFAFWLETKEWIPISQSSEKFLLKTFPGGLDLNIHINFCGFWAHSS